jgi:hypothetical protein
MPETQQNGRSQVVSDFWGRTRGLYIFEIPAGNRACPENVLRQELRPKASTERLLITGLGAVAGYMLCGMILRMIGPSSDESVIRWFSALAGVLFAAVAWKIG